MFLNQDARGKLVDLGYMPWACVQISQGGVEDEFLGSRILFFTTYATKSHILDLIDSHKLADSIVKNLARHTEALPSTPADPIVDMALTDTLNLLFNVTSFLYKEHPNKLSAFGGTIPHIVSLLLKRQIPSPGPLDRPMDKLISALINMKLEKCSDILYPCSSPTALPCRFVELMDRAFSAYSDSELETILTPLAALLIRILPSMPPEVRSYMKSQLLPQDSDRSQVLGRGDSLPSKILRNTTNAMAPELSSLLSHLLFELSDSDAAQFVDNVGYGFASGYLFQHNIPVPFSVQEAHADIRPVNPITGQYVENETVLDMPEMTKEEKEREAERLFILFERCDFQFLHLNSRQLTNVMLGSDRLALSILITPLLKHTKLDVFKISKVMKRGGTLTNWHKATPDFSHCMTGYLWKVQDARVVTGLKVLAGRCVLSCLLDAVCRLVHGSYLALYI